MDKLCRNNDKYIGACPRFKTKGDWAEERLGVKKGKISMFIRFHTTNSFTFVRQTKHVTIKDPKDMPKKLEKILKENVSSLKFQAKLHVPLQLPRAYWSLFKEI